jgi:hypothetical protein
MNLRRIDTDGDIPLGSQNKSGVEAIAEAFLRSLKRADSRIEADPQVEQSDPQLPVADSYSLGLGHGGRCLEEEEETWGKRQFIGQDLRDKTLKRSWLVRPFQRNQAKQSSINLASSTAVSDEFKNRVLELLKNMPEKFTEAVRNNHTEFLIVGNLAEVDDDLAFRPARRHPQQELIGNLSAYYEARLNALVFAENPGTKAESIARSVAHEFGRALDRALDNFSLSYEFDQAFYRDMARLSPPEKSALWCFTAPCSEIFQSQDSFEAAKEELFAELFAVSQGMGCASKEIDDLLVGKFPTVMNAITKRIAALAEAGGCP